MLLDPNSFWNDVEIEIEIDCFCVHCVDKDRELSEAQAEIKALRHSERLREKAVEEVKIITLIYAFLFLIMLLFN